MIEDYEVKKIRINKPVAGKSVGDIVNIKTKNGIPIDRYWRDRKKDSKIDDCISFVDGAKKPVKSDKKKE